MSTRCRWMLWCPQSHQGRAQLATPAPPRPDCGAMLFALGFFSSLFPAWRDGKEERGGSSPVPSQHARHGSGSTGFPMQLWTLVHFWGIKAPALCMGVEEAALSSMVLSACFSWIQNISQASSPMCFPLMGAADSRGRTNSPHPCSVLLLHPKCLSQGPGTGLDKPLSIPNQPIFDQYLCFHYKYTSWPLVCRSHPSPCAFQAGENLTLKAQLLASGAPPIPTATSER